MLSAVRVECMSIHARVHVFCICSVSCSKIISRRPEFNSGSEDDPDISESPQGKRGVKAAAKALDM